MSSKFVQTLTLFLASCVFCCVGFAQTYQYIRIGNKKDAQTTPSAGVAMMGGGTDLDDAFRWLCQKANGGDFLILRAAGGDDYNSYVNGLCKLNSVATLIIPDRASALDPAVAEIIRRAEALFIAGGDQARYVNFWKTTPVQEAINDAVAGGRPIGGTSAGLAVEGEFAYSAMNDPPDDSELVSKDALANPFFPRVAVVRDFVKISILQDTLTDSHFAKRDRMGRTLVFLARIMQSGWSKDPREIAVDEKSAVLVEPDGKGLVVGSGKGAYFLKPTRAPEVCRENMPLTFREVAVSRVATGSHFDLATWTGENSVNYSLSVEKGAIQSSAADHSVY
jgi:cyanophycinase